MNRLRKTFLKLSRALSFIIVVLAWHASVLAASLNLQWSDNSSNESGFKIERKTGTGGSYSQIGTVGANVTSYNDAAIAGGSTYCYRVRAFNGAGDSGYSNDTCASVPAGDPNVSFGNRAPVANAGPDMTVNEGAPVMLSGAASSDPDGNALTFSWTQVGGPAVTLSGATSARPSFTAPLVGYFGALLTFQLAVRDTGGLSSADIVVVRVNSVLSSTIINDFVNVSTRSASGTADNIMIVGFILEGTAPKTVLVRGLGPSMADVGIPGVMANPTLNLYSGSQLIASNDNWQDTQAAEITATGLDPCQPWNPGGPPPTGCNLESGIYVTLDAGAYTAHLRGANGGTGIGLADVFALSEGGAELVNISTRSVAGIGDGVIIGGFMIEGSEAKTVLIRGRGPTLADLGVKGVLANPTLKLYSGSQVIASNDNWQDSQATEVAATGLDPCQPLTQGGTPPTGCNLESAIVTTLEPGAYTAQLSGVNSGTGVGLVEVFNLD